MKKEELELLRKLNSSMVSEAELVDIFFQTKDNKRVLLNLVVHPKFPEKYSLDIIPRLIAMDLIRVVKNKRTRPAIRKKAELEFCNRFIKFPLGEKLGYLKTAPYSLLLHFIEEENKDILEAIIKNINCTEELILRFINRKNPRHLVYEVLLSTEWYKRPFIAEAISFDQEAPIKAILAVIPFLSRRVLKELYMNEGCHKIVKNNIIKYVKLRSNTKD
jgi:hypothetical protein